MKRDFTTIINVIWTIWSMMTILMMKIMKKINEHEGWQTMILKIHDNA